MHPADGKRPKVFISYSHDSEEHRARVRALADRLRHDGVDCTIDQYEPDPPEGWLSWMERQLDEADFVLVVCTETYLLRAKRRERPGLGHGARFEGSSILQEIYDAGMLNEKYLPVLFEEIDRRLIPRALRPYTFYRIDESGEEYANLLRRLFHQPAAVRPEMEPRKIRLRRARAPIRVVALIIALLVGSGATWIWWRSHQASKLYEEGRQAMAVLDLPLARRSFAEALDYVDRPVVRSSLAEALMMLGNDVPARAEAERAFQQSDSLSPHDRRLVEARYRKIHGHWDEAIVVYRQLQEEEPSEVEYALGVAESQIALGNCRQALTVTAMAPNSPGPRLALAAAKAASCLSDFQRQSTEASRAIEEAEKRGLKLLSADGLLIRGSARVKLGKPKDALDDFHEALKRAKGNLPQIAVAQHEIASVLSATGDLQNAERFYGNARDSYKRLGDEEGEAVQRDALAGIYLQEGKIGKAQREYEEVIELYDDRGFQPLKALAVGNLGISLAQQGDLAGAEERLEDAIRISKEVSDLEQEATYQCILSRVYLENLQPTLAERSLEACRDAKLGIDAPYLEADALSVQGDLLFFQGDLKRAPETHQRAHKIYEGLGNQAQVAWSLRTLATIQLERNLFSEAEPLARSALSYFAGQKMLDEKALTEVVLARILLAQGLPRRARSLLEETRGYVETSETLELRVRFALAEAHVLAATGDVPGARRILASQLADPRNRRDPRLRMETRLAEGEIELAHGDPARGRSLLSEVKEDAAAHGFGLVESTAARLLIHGGKP